MDYPILETRDLHKSYFTPAQEVPVLRGVDLKIYSGEIVSIVGKSGVGKTTLLNLVGLLDTPTKGSIYLFGKEVTGLNKLEYCIVRNQHIGIVFQFYHLLPDFTALENVILSTMIHDPLFGKKRQLSEEIEEKALYLLKLVGLGHRLDHYPYQLSGGERQRVAIARALMNNPKIVLFDEPTGNLDGKTSLEIHCLLWELQAMLDKTFVVVTHEESLAQRADRIIHMVDGKIKGIEQI
ncbi:MAG: ABC transporter ATP-binding protein [Planctomycetota bacterium]|nr:MAG: ABC transporter ATP-binding protein [Planctomycetota bacterium]